MKVFSYLLEPQASIRGMSLAHVKTSVVPN